VFNLLFALTGTILTIYVPARLSYFAHENRDNLTHENLQKSKFSGFFKEVNNESIYQVIFLVCFMGRRVSFVMIIGIFENYAVIQL
jgi:hypothetical protein